VNHDACAADGSGEGGRACSCWCEFITRKTSDGDGKTKKKRVYTPISPTRPPPPMRVLVLAVLAF
jgi:hypothetical protein